MAFDQRSFRSKKQPCIGLSYSSLENRCLLAIALSGGDLNMYGTNNADSATVTMHDSLTVRVNVNGAVRDYSLTSIDELFFYGFGGNDNFVNSTAIRVTAYGGSGNDYLQGGTNADLLVGQDGHDVLSGVSGGDTLSGGNGVDTIYGGAGNDKVYGSNGNDILYGGGNDDFILGGNNDDFISGGSGDDVASGEFGHDDIHGGSGDDVLYGGHQNDTLNGDAGNDRVFGFGDDDNLSGGEGDDHLIGGFGNDTVEGNAGNDFIAGNEGDDALNGNAGNDTLYGSPGHDEIIGGDGNDFASGGSGNDQIDGGAGVDQISGNAGDDTLAGGDDNDTIYGGDGMDSLFGDAGADILFGFGDADYLVGGSGNDQLNGGDSNDRLFGESGNDWLFGGNGNDGLFGGIGSGDQLQGDAGSDRFMIWAGDSMLDRNALEAQIEFKNETSSWTEAEIAVIDDGLHWLQEQAGTSLIIRDSLDTDPVIYSKWNTLNGAAGINSLTTYWNWRDGYRYDREIQFYDWNENSTFYNEQMTLTAIHEIGHSWDSTLEIENVLAGQGSLWTEFTAISSWTESNPNSNSYLQSHDGQWWYHQNASFAYNYGRTNPYEDWATIFEEAYDVSNGHGVNSNLAEKLAIFEQLMAAFPSE